MLFSMNVILKKCYNALKKSEISLKYILIVFFEDNNKYKLIYASKQYLLSMEKNSLVNYNNFHRDRSYSDTDVIILNFINKKNNNINAPFSYEEYLRRIS